jgi:hypothetical protein
LLKLDGQNVIAKANSDLKKRNIEIEDKNNLIIFFWHLYLGNQKNFTTKMDDWVRKNGKSTFNWFYSIEDLLERCFYIVYGSEVISKSRINIEQLKK